MVHPETFWGWRRQVALRSRLEAGCGICDMGCESGEEVGSWTEDFR